MKKRACSIKFFIFLCFGASQCFAADRFNCFAELSANKILNQDYSIEVVDRASPVTILAIHGGNIEAPTSQLARAVAGVDYNTYLFEGLRDSRDLHITSSKFDEPQAVKLVEKSDITISLHGFKREKDEFICVGGLNQILARLVAQSLSTANFAVQFPCGIHPGVHPKNIANLSASAGVQIEISSALRQVLKTDSLNFTDAIRAAVVDYQKNFGSRP